ncbi:flagellar basal body-associated FliL family protein [Thiocystis violacea]|uniref:flagellar basal body-associated FliL family protein n=1 Tax=Thiocystis violacea TaxID=13725 RepID=UPI001905A516|nr:flagellar basal body-associated FliL family protein [Thiocystis violacea]MBK1716707.1 hypothetical protein [Thiocystis violacea]
MADKKKAVKTEAAPGEKAPSNKLKWILLGLILLLVLGGGGGAAYYFLIHKAADPAEETSGEATEAEAEAPAHAPAHAPAIPAQAPLIYHKLENFTVNLASPGPVRFLRTSLSIVTQNEAVIAALDKHMPMIRNDVLALLASQEFAVINTADGKQALREQLKQTITGLLVKSGEPSAIQDVLFTDLVMQ